MQSKSHAAKIENSDRLRRTLAVISDGDNYTARDIARHTKSMAVHTDIHELRENGFVIQKEYMQPPCGGRMLPHYQLISSPE